MSWLPVEVEYRVGLLQRELNYSTNQIAIYEMGLRDEQKSLNLQWAYRQALLEAVRYLQSTDGVTVSLAEYKNIKVDLSTIDTTIKQKYIAIANLNKAIVEKRKEIIMIKNQIYTLSMTNRRGVILEFRKNYDNR